jgi:hypothetical protein
MNLEHLVKFGTNFNVPKMLENTFSIYDRGEPAVSYR